tara:strand:+ start:5123 stop:5671 length:549 start_codon:yes stop_codon:yes gene_type:complete
LFSSHDVLPHNNSTNQPLIRFYFLDMPKKSAVAGELASKSAGGKKKSVSRADKAGLTMSVSKVHNAMLKFKQHPKSKGVTRVSVGGPVWVTAAIEYFAAELLEQAGLLTTSADQKGGARKRITLQDIVTALRSDDEMDKAMAGFRILAGDKISSDKISEELTGEKKKKKGKKDDAPVANTQA